MTLRPEICSKFPSELRDELGFGIRTSPRKPGTDLDGEDRAHGHAPVETRRATAVPERCGRTAPHDRGASCVGHRAFDVLRRPGGRVGSAIDSVIAGQRQLIEESKHRGDPRAVRGVRRQDGAAPAAAVRKGRHRQQHRPLLRGGRRRADREIAPRSEDEAAQLRLVHGAGRVVPRRRAARPLVRRRGRRYQQLQVVQRHARPRRSAIASSSASRTSCRTRSGPRTSSRVERSGDVARSARAVRRRRVLLPDPRPARVRRGGRDCRPLQGGGRRARLDARRSAAWRSVRSESTSGSSACGSDRSPSVAASRASSPPS